MQMTVWMYGRTDCSQEHTKEKAAGEVEDILSSPAPEKLQTWNQSGKGAEIS